MWQRTVALIAAFLAEGGTIQTRVRELSTGVVEDMPRGLTLAGGALHAEAVMAALAQFEAQGLVTYADTVHRHDSSEYIRGYKHI